MAASVQSYQNKRCIIFDFDCTLTSSHTVKVLPNTKPELSQKIDDLNAQLDPDEIDKNVFDSRVQILKYFFELLQKNGIDIYISSRGWCRTIRRVLESVGLLKYIYTKEVEISDGHKINLPVINAQNSAGEGCYRAQYFPKDVMIRDLIRTYDTVVYVDDDHQEHKVFVDNPTELDVLKNLSDHGARNKYADQREQITPYMEKEIHRDSKPSAKYVFISDLPKEGHGLSQEQIDMILKVLKIKPEIQSGGRYYYKYAKYKSKYELFKTTF